MENMAHKQVQTAKVEEMRDQKIQQMDKNMVTCCLILDIEKKIDLVQKDGLWIFTDIAGKRNKVLKSL